MPVDAAGLNEDLENLFKPENHPASAAEAAKQWAAVIGKYATGVAPPSTTVAAAQMALEPAFLAALQQPFPDSAAALDAAFVAFAATIFGGMPPPPPPPPPPPAAGPGWAAQLGNSEPSSESAAASFTTFIDTWFRSTGWS